MNTASTSPRADNTLLTAWLLLLLARGGAHGYELSHALGRHGISADRSRIYRTLRKLEEDGCIESHWMDPVAGPRRRQYELTPKGTENLRELIGSIIDTRDRCEMFLELHKGASAAAPAE